VPVWLRHYSNTDGGRFANTDSDIPATYSYANADSYLPSDAKSDSYSVPIPDYESHANVNTYSNRSS